METHHGFEHQSDRLVDVLQVEVPSIGTPEEDPKTVDLKLRQVQKEKGTMKVGCWLSMPFCIFVAPVKTLPLPLCTSLVRSEFYSAGLPDAEKAKASDKRLRYSGEPTTYKAPSQE